MPEPINPYAAPATVEMHPKAAEWLGTPNESLRRTATGLGLVRTGLVLIIINILIGFVGGMLIAAGGGNLDTLRLFLFVLGAIAIIASILGLVGKVFCLSTPAETEAQGWIYAAVGAEVLSLLITAAAVAGLITEANQQTAGHVQQLLNIVAAITFVLFLRKLSMFIGRTDLAQRAMNLLILGAILVGLVLVAIFGGVLAMGNIQANGPQAAGQAMGGMAGLILIVGLGMLVIGLVALAKYLSLLADLKSAIITGR